MSQRVIAMAPGDVPLQRAYLRCYFFSEYLGVGMPDDLAIRSSLSIVGRSGREGAAAARNAHLQLESGNGTRHETGRNASR